MLVPPHRFSDRPFAAEEHVVSLPDAEGRSGIVTGKVRRTDLRL